MNYKLCVKETERIVNKTKLRYPRMKNSIHADNLMQFIGQYRQLLYPKQQRLYSEKKYEQVLSDLKKVKIDKRIKRLSGKIV